MALARNIDGKTLAGDQTELNMKILLTTHQFLPDYSAGTEVLTFSTAKELTRLGHEVHVFTGYPAKVELRDEERFDCYVHEGIPVRRFHHALVPMGRQSNFMESEYNNLLFATRFKEYLSEFKPDIVHFFHLGRLSASAIDVCEELKIPMILTPTDFWFICFMNQLRLPDHSFCTGPDKNRINCLRHCVELSQQAKISSVFKNIPDSLLSLLICAIQKGLFGNKGYPAYVKALLNRTDFLVSRLNKIDKVLVPTRLMERILEKNGLESQRVIYNPFGIDIHEMEKQAKKYGGGVLKVGFIGTLCEHKGTHVLLQALRLRPDAPIALKLYGKLDDFPDYVAQLRGIACNDSRVSFCGTFPNQEIRDIFAGIDVLVVPSIWYENTPLVVLSAQAAGCPVIASDVGGISEVIEHGINGLVFQPGDVTGLAGCLDQLLQRDVSLEHLSANAKKPKSIAEYTAENVRTYQDIISRR